MRDYYKERNSSYRELYDKITVTAEDLNNNYFEYGRKLDEQQKELENKYTASLSLVYSYVDFLLKVEGQKYLEIYGAEMLYHTIEIHNNVLNLCSSSFSKLYEKYNNILYQVSPKARNNKAKEDIKNIKNRVDLLKNRERDIIAKNTDYSAVGTILLTVSIAMIVLSFIITPWILMYAMPLLSIGIVLVIKSPSKQKKKRIIKKYK